MGPLKNTDSFKVFLEFDHSIPTSSLKVKSIGFDRIYFTESHVTKNLKSIQKVKVYLNALGEWRSYSVKPLFPQSADNLSELFFKVSEDDVSHFERDFALAWC